MNMFYNDVYIIQSFLTGFWDFDVEFVFYRGQLVETFLSRKK